MGTGAGERRGGSGRGWTERLFLIHLMVYVLIQAMLFLTDLADGGNWWFFYPLLGWGVALAVHGVVTYGSPGDAVRAHRPNADRVPLELPVHRDVVVPATQGSAAALAEEAEARVARLWRVARRIEAPDVREQAFRVCSAADRVAEALAVGTGDATAARVFRDRYLGPAETVMEGYVRVAGRGLSAAEPALTKVADRDLPLLETKLTELYERIHRGDVIDLEVAGEMLALDLEGSPVPPLRRPTT